MLQRERAGDFITSVVLGWYLAHRALNKHNEQNQRDFKAVRSEAFRQDQAHNELRDEFNRYAADKANQEALEKRQQALKRTPETPGPATPEQIAAIQQQVEAAANQSKVHIEQDAWKRYVMVNGKLEQSAIEYGKAFREEQRAEQAGNHFGLPDQGGGPVRQGGPMFGQTPMLGSGQADPRFQLPSSDYPIDEQHLLQASYSSPILDAAKNPWVWAGVGILILAFFTAAFV